MIKVHIHKALFYAYHGIHEEERVIGGEFELELEVMFEESVNIIQDLKGSVNYADLYNIAEEKMKMPEPLIETVAMRIGEEIYLKFKAIKRISVSIKKLHPPLMHFRGNVGVNWIKEY